MRFGAENKLFPPRVLLRIGRRAEENMEKFTASPSFSLRGGKDENDFDEDDFGESGYNENDFDEAAPQTTDAQDGLFDDNFGDDRLDNDGQIDGGSDGGKNQEVPFFSQNRGVSNGGGDEKGKGKSSLFSPSAMLEVIKEHEKRKRNIKR